MKPHNKNCPNIEIWFNDIGLSEIEPPLPKIERVKKYSKGIYRPENVSVKFFQMDFSKILSQAIEKFASKRNSRALFFIDPYGYKNIKPENISEIISKGTSEVLLFLPVSFMYRFAQSSIEKDFPGSGPLREFLQVLFDNEIPLFSSSNDFISKLKDRFTDYLSEYKTFVDTFTLDNGKNIFALFFFTTTVLGLEKLLEAKWKLDADFGRGFKANVAQSLFSAYEMENYPLKLLQFIDSDNGRTNQELYLFGLKNGFLPKHSNRALKSFAGKIIVESLDQEPVRGNYINAKTDRRIIFRIIKKDISDVN